MADVIRDVIRRLSFDITEIDAHLEDYEYDADSSENEGCKKDDDVMIDEEHEIDEAKVEKINIDDFDTDSGGEGDGAVGRGSALNKLKKAFMQDLLGLTIPVQKKPNKMENGHKEGTKNLSQKVETASENAMTPSEELVTASGLAVKNEALETLAWRRRLEIL
ncbi:hypothetical protein Tco_0787978 [Tanacetum coccineum]